MLETRNLQDQIGSWHAAAECRLLAAQKFERLQEMMQEESVRHPNSVNARVQTLVSQGAARGVHGTKNWALGNRGLEKLLPVLLPDAELREQQ